MDVSSRTIDRRLIEVGLFGRVARHQKKFSTAEKRKRLSFAEGYKSWTAENWKHVMFADEKIFWGEGFWGQVFVRRPKGEALNPDYCGGPEAASGQGQRVGMLLRQGARLLLHLQREHGCQAAEED